MTKLTLLGDVNIHVRCALRHTAVTALYQTFFCQSVLLKMTPRTVGSFFSLILAIFSLSFNEVKGRSVEKLEEIVTGKLGEIWDEIEKQDEKIWLLKKKDLKTTEEIKSLKQQIEELKSISTTAKSRMDLQDEEIKQLKKKELNTTEEIKSLKQQIEESKSTFKQQIEELKSTFKQQIEEFKSISTTAKSCFQLGLQGIQKDGQFKVDPDGQHVKNPPIDVGCHFSENLTIIGEEFNFEFEQCPTIKCSETTLEYEAETDQIKILMEDSGICSQTIHFHCKNAPLVSKLYPLGPWLLRNSLVCIFKK